MRELRKKRKKETLEKGWPEVPKWIFCSTRGGVMNAGNFRKRIWELWRAIRGSNPGPLVPETNALSTELIALLGGSMRHAGRSFD